MAFPSPPPFSSPGRVQTVTEEMATERTMASFRLRKSLLRGDIGENYPERGISQFLVRAQHLRF